MKIRPRNIPIFQNGGGVPQWYLDRYGNRTLLLGWDLNKRYNYANQNLNTNDHRNAGNLDTVYKKNVAYTGTPGAISSDILTFYNSDGRGMSAEDFVNFYNSNAAKIRWHWTQDLTYNAKTAGEHNRLFKKMFASRSNLSQSPGNNYNIGYLDNLEDVEGSSTWLRRMDLYENEFDPNNPDSNRLHEITLSDGNKATVYKKANGDIGLLSIKNEVQQTPDTPVLLDNTQITTSTTEIPTEHNNKYGFDWNKIGEGILKIFGNPNLYAFGRLAGNLYNNERVYDELLKGIRPVLRLTYNTYRQVVGDEATKLAYYKRATLGQTKAARPFTSDADRQMAYQFEAKRIGDELRAQGDLADNAEIRRTSDESNQHQWANTQRAAEVANANIASINQANALKHNLLALKHSALWSSIDNFLQGIEYRKRLRLAEDLAFDDLIFALLQLLDLLYDDRIINARREYLNILDKHKNSDGSYDLNNDEVIEAKRKYQAILNQIAIELYKKKRDYQRNKTIIAKSGTKITHKKKDDLLYKSTKDVIEHFRKMSKLSSDALNRKTPKIERLTTHPKGKTKKYLLGGVAPFTIYKPVTLGGETTTSSEISTSGTRQSSKKEESNTLDMIKELFKAVAGKGLPSDVNSLYTSVRNFLNRASAFGEELSTDDIASMYLSQMQQLNQILYLKENFDKVRDLALSNDALGEFAVDNLGRLVSQNPDSGELEFTNSLNEALEKGYIPLSNSLLLDLRATAFAGRTDIDRIVANGIGLNKVGEYIKNMIPLIQSDETKSELFVKIKLGIKALESAPEGDYKLTITDKNNLRQALYALKYLKGILPRNMRAVLELNAQQNRMSADDMLASLISSKTLIEHQEEYIPYTGKAAKDANGNSKSGDIKSNFLVQILKDLIGIPRKFSMITKDGNSELYSLNSKYISQLPNVTEDMSVDKMLGESKVGSILDSGLGITFGDLVISPENLKDIMFDKSGGATVVTLPCRWENGHKVVNFEIKDKFDEAIKEAELIVPINYLDPKFNEVLALKLKEKNLNSLVIGDLLDPDMFGHFMVISAYTTDKVKFKNFNSKYIEKVNNPDKSLEDRLIKGLSTNKDKNDYKVDIDDTWGWFEGTWDDVYRGNVFIPLNNDPISAQTGWGNDNIKLDEAKELATQYQIWSKMEKVKSTDSSLL